MDGIRRATPCYESALVGGQVGDVLNTKVGELEDRSSRKKEKKRSRHRKAREERRREEERVRRRGDAREDGREEGHRKKGDERVVVRDEEESRRKESESSKKQDEGSEIKREHATSRRKDDAEPVGDFDSRRRRDADFSRRRDDSSRRKDEEVSSDYETSSRRIRKPQEQERRVRREEHSPSGSPKSSRVIPITKSGSEFDKSIPLRVSVPEVSRTMSRKSRRAEVKHPPEFSSSVSRGLVGDLDVSQSTKSRRKKERREKKKRERREQRESMADDRQMFESIRNIMPRDGEPIAEGGSEMNKPQHVPDSSAVHTRQPLSGVAKSVYIGVCNFAKAEEQVEKRSDFRVYHQLAHRPLLDDLEQELPLIVVYKTANGSFRHYPIRRRKVGSASYYYVDYGDPKVQAHASLDHLVRYYQINAQRHPNNRQYADQFPWWEVHL
ncbi:hypothetical protein Y032_0009g492 [Ancylostoma ceylanicum]|uniref:SH2 domain-containing protein n=1 Tax=Ancylostoma ceylanicum TaxID=53326 RepID=A0A016VJZ7_9BILA|nr:hypothetical protein Y032_0009g492 [Ancylostoma ceylanicum]